MCLREDTVVLGNVKTPFEVSKAISYFCTSDCLSVRCELFLQSTFRCLSGIEPPLTIETSIISERICKPCTGSEETNWKGEGMCVHRVCRGNVIQLCVHGPERMSHTTVLTWMATVPSASSCRSASAIKVCSHLCCR